jgi:hypothetical protein
MNGDESKLVQAVSNRSVYCLRTGLEGPGHSLICFTEITAGNPLSSRNEESLNG